MYALCLQTRLISADSVGAWNISGDQLDALLVSYNINIQYNIVM